MSALERSAPAVEPVLEGRRAPGASGAGADQRTLRGLVRYFLKLGASGFGGPIALVGYMQRDLVEERRWFSQSEFEQAVASGRRCRVRSRRRRRCGLATCTRGRAAHWRSRSRS